MVTRGWVEAVEPGSYMMPRLGGDLTERMGWKRHGLVPGCGDEGCVSYWGNLERPVMKSCGLLFRR